MEFRSICPGKLPLIAGSRYITSQSSFFMEFLYTESTEASAGSHLLRYIFVSLENSFFRAGAGVILTLVRFFWL